MPVRIEIHGLDELRARFARFPSVYKAKEHKTLEASLLALWEAVPPYPPARKGSWYKRTGTLGRSIGSDMQGGKLGPPDIMEIKQGSGMGEASFGTRLEYAPDVIGEQQDPFFRERGWWTIKTIAEKAKSRIHDSWKRFAEDLAAFLDGKRGM